MCTKSRHTRSRRTWWRSLLFRPMTAPPFPFACKGSLTLEWVNWTWDTVSLCLSGCCLLFTVCFSLLDPCTLRIPLESLAMSLALLLFSSSLGFSPKSELVRALKPKCYCFSFSLLKSLPCFWSQSRQDTIMSVLYLTRIIHQWIFCRKKQVQWLNMNMVISN